MQLTKTIFQNSAIFIEKKWVENRLWGKGAFLWGERINSFSTIVTSNVAELLLHASAGGEVESGKYDWNGGLRLNVSGRAAIVVVIVSTVTAAITRRTEALARCLPCLRACSGFLKEGGDSSGDSSGGSGDGC